MSGAGGRSPYDADLAVNGTQLTLVIYYTPGLGRIATLAHQRASVTPASWARAAMRVVYASSAAEIVLILARSAVTVASVAGMRTSVPAITVIGVLQGIAAACGIGALAVAPMATLISVRCESWLAYRRLREAQGGVTSSPLSRDTRKCVELVPFPGERPARAWMQNRVRGTEGPLRTSPACRASREEELLAWLIRAAHAGRPWDLLSQVVWTSHLRAELYQAAQTHGMRAVPADPGDSLTVRIRSTFTHWLAFAPGWAADDLGWPDARHARAYFSRLAVTSVSEVQALRAADALVRSDTEAAARTGVAMPETAVVAAVAGGPAGRRVPRGQRTAESQSETGRPNVKWRGLQQPPQRQPRQAGPEPR